jgi:RNA polymerase sigma-70 factor (ECF subfamily)
METRRDGFERLAWPLLDALYRTARSLVGAASAEDVVQEAIVRAWRSYGRFQQGTNFRAWIFRILFNAALNARRDAARRPVEVLAGEVPDRDVVFLRPEDVDRADDPAARAAIAALAPEFRAVFLLATFEEFSYREISEALGIPMGTVMSRLFRARAQLRAAIARRVETP